MTPSELVWKGNWRLIDHRNPPSIFLPKFRHLNRGVYKVGSNQPMLILQVCQSPKS